MGQVRSKESIKTHSIEEEFRYKHCVDENKEAEIVSFSYASWEPEAVVV